MRAYRPRQLRDAGIAPRKALGQHFLTDSNYVNRIIAAAELTPQSVVVEVGPGLGVLTQKLTEAAKHVIALEFDTKLAHRLRASAPPNLTVVEGDALEIGPEPLLEAASLPPDTAYSIVANLPYNAGTAIVRRFLEAGHQPRRLIVMLQREVADSMTAPAGESSLLGISVNVYADARRLFSVPPRAFYPPPRVTSAVVRLDVRPQPLVPTGERERFFGVLRAGFSAPRKQLRNTLAQGLAIDAPVAAAAIQRAGLDPTLRPQQLSTADWLRLSQTVDV